MVATIARKVKIEGDLENIEFYSTGIGHGFMQNFGVVLRRTFPEIDTIKRRFVNDDCFALEVKLAEDFEGQKSDMIDAIARTTRDMLGYDSTSMPVSFKH